MRFQVLPYQDSYDASQFECLDEALTRYIKSSRALRDINSRQAAIFVMLDDSNTIRGYYTLSAASVDRGSFSGTKGRSFGYPEVAVTLLGRVAIHKQLKGKGIGKELILHALKKAAIASAFVASAGVVLDAKNERVAQLYSEMGFISLKNRPLRMFISMSTIEHLLIED